MNRALKKKLVQKAIRDVQKNQGNISELEKLLDMPNDQLDAIKSSKLVQMIDQIKQNCYFNDNVQERENGVVTEETVDGGEQTVGVGQAEEPKF